ncbi:hypothetical protein [Marinomonas transparens]|uniref:Uncharacterized protein n=1 Tax=Marinomonas transparens TaxID=2795388 RepID=A0A934JRM0_9GAMM|nr:hypothetical protein [Marinomonas transparens]MBJ7539428.1 hypothetical protein [Marinomonas transparens]
MSLTQSAKQIATSAQVAAISCALTMDLVQWVQHYQAETVDLRYFFHSGWSS